MAGRREPMQERAKESVAGILGAAAALLDEVGLEGFNTNLLAERANVRVSTIYRYYPNKYVIIAELTRALSVRWNEWMEPLYAALADPRQDWRASMRSAASEWIRRARSEPGSISVLQAVNATPELRDIHRGIFDHMCGRLMEALKQRGVRLPPARLLGVARACTTIQNAAAEIYLSMSGAEAETYREELALSIERYLEPYMRVERKGR